MLSRRQPLAAAQHRALTLRDNFSWTFVGNVVYAASQWGILTVLAKLGSPEMVGQFALGLAIAAPVVMFTNLQLRGVLATDARDEYRFGDYLALRLCATLLAMLTISGLVLLGGYSWQTSLVISAGRTGERRRSDQRCDLRTVPAARAYGTDLKVANDQRAAIAGGGRRCRPG